MFWKKTIILGMIAAALFFGQPARAAGDTLPEFNPLCWHEQQCLDIRKSVFGASDQDAAKGWDNKQPPCVGEWGKCLPAGETVTQIALGGDVRFSNLGEYIQKVYNYLVGVAGILAVIMIIVAGAQWISSGGNTETITTAKKRITGAVIGLLIAYLSYFILNTINPALVQLRLPQVWLVRPQTLTPEFCSDLDASSTYSFAFAGHNGDKNNADASSATFDKDINYVIDQNCGERFYISGSSAAVCVADKCQNDSQPICAKDTAPGKVNTYACTDSVIVGRASGGYLVQPGCVSKVFGFAKGFLYPYIVQSSYGVIVPVCMGADQILIPSIGYGKGTIIVTPDDKNKVVNFEVKLSSSDFDYLQVADSGACGNSNSRNIVGYLLQLSLKNACFGQQNHFFGAGGLHLGSRENYLSPTELTQNKLIQLIDLQKGVSMSIDISAVPYY